MVVTGSLLRNQSRGFANQMGAQQQSGLADKIAQVQADQMNQQARQGTPYEIRHGYYGGMSTGGLYDLQNVYGVLGNPSNEPKPKLSGLGAWLPQKKDKEASIMNYMKDYFVKHRELLMGLTIVVLLDHFIFGGAFRDKIERIVKGILDKAETKLAKAD